MKNKRKLEKWKKEGTIGTLRCHIFQFLYRCGLVSLWSSVFLLYDIQLSQMQLTFCLDRFEHEKLKPKKKASNELFLLKELLLILSFSCLKRSKIHSFIF